METTFITIHDLSPEAHILYSSDSIVDVLGYEPHEVVNRSCWDFFHPEEIPLAQERHARGVKNDKASMLSYCRMRDRGGYYLGCEIVFTVVYDCMVGCTSIYRRGLKSQDRALEAPVVRRLFSTSPRDPRYHMLEHLSSKFETSAKPSLHERRAALFLNRYTRTLTIMYATDGLADELGISGEELRGRSFYYCIQRSCLGDAVRCLENAKANDSIAYLRFWFRDPRQDDSLQRNQRREDSMDVGGMAEPNLDTRSISEDTDMGGVKIEEDSPPSLSPPRHPALERSYDASRDSPAISSDSSIEPLDRSGDNLNVPKHNDSRTSSGDSIDPRNTTEHIFGERDAHHSSESSVTTSPEEERPSAFGDRRPIDHPVELEAVVSCTSDGMVVCLRRARAPLPAADLKQVANQPAERDGVYAVPWATDPVMPSFANKPIGTSPSALDRSSVSPLSASSPPNGQDFMASIREIAVFAWALTGINGSLADYGTGKPRGESQPAQGLPVWTPSTAEERVNGLQTRDSPSRAPQHPHE